MTLSNGTVPDESQKLGEIIEASTVQVVAQSYELNVAPPFGSLVRMPHGPPRTSGAVYGVVTCIETTALDASRRPMARGQDADSRQAVFEQHPQLTELFRTHFTIHVLGYAMGDGIHHALPPLPPEIHQFVYTCTREQVGTFTASPGYLPLLLAATGPAGDEAVSTFLRGASAVRSPSDAESYLVAAAKQLIVLLRGDATRLNTLLGRLA
ncbi:MAG: hypothetical protein EXR51_10525 [Dehalococcoidia bacterium]|nr:hypothetical protein [Dehalococcoidia bacterium]